MQNCNDIVGARREPIRRLAGIWTMSKKSYAALGAAFAVATLPANGWGAERTVEKSAPSGGQIEIAFLFDLNPDCSSNWSFDVKTKLAPVNGVINIRRGFGYPHVSSISRLSACSDKRMPVVQVYYKSTKGYVGPDKVILDTIFHDGSEFIYQVNITVK